MATSNVVVQQKSRQQHKSAESAPTFRTIIHELAILSLYGNWKNGQSKQQ